MMMSELNSGAPRQARQQQTREQAGSFHRTSENHLCWFMDHGSEVLLPD